MTARNLLARTVPAPPARTDNNILVRYPMEPDERPFAYLGRLMEMLPPPPGDVVEQIMTQILDTESPFDENMVWDTLSSKDAVGRRFVFHSVHVQPSDYENSPLPFFLVAKVTDLESGEQTVLTTGSVNVVTSLVKAQLLGNLPWAAEIMGPRKPTQNGYLPLHIRWQARVVENPEVIDV